MEGKPIDQLEALFRALFEAAQDAVLIADDNGRYVNANPAAGELLGLPPEQLKGRHVEEFVHEISGGVHDAWDAFQKAGFQKGECLIRKADGTLVDVEYSAKTSFVPGLHLSILRDITERRRVERALARQATELRRSNADLQQFAYFTSHDLQEPLRTVTSLIEILGSRYQGRLDKDADESLSHTLSAVHRIRSFIDALLSYSHVVSGDPAPFAPVEMAHVLEWAKMNLQTFIEGSQATVTNGDLPTLPGIELQLVQLFQNLIGNAIKYKGPELPHVAITAERLEKEWLFSVRDNGIGISPQHTEYIFGVFRRLHGKEIPGTGIGLAICRRIVENHGGRIWVESEPDQGSTFWFTLSAGEQAGMAKFSVRAHACCRT